jgi:RNA polymerase sigma-70 factor (ECF subfamily)
LADPDGPGSLPDEAALRRRIRGFAFRMTGDAHLAEDVAQETLVRVLGGDGPRDLPWVLRVALNLVRTEYRRAARRRAAPAMVDRVADPRAGDPLDAMAAAEERERFWERFGHLPEKERTALVLRFAEGLTCADIARVFGTSPNAVSCLLHRGKERARALLSERSVAR